MKKVLILCAMKVELDAVVEKMTSHQVIHGDYVGIINGVQVVASMCGIGKVAAAITLIQKQQRHHVNIVINVGVAGTLDPEMNIGDVILADKVGYHDVDLTVFDYKLGQMAQLPELFDTNYAYINGIEGTKIGTVLSGDQFVTTDLAIKTKANFGAISAIEMEAGAIAHAAHDLGIETVIIRSISDKPLEEGNNVQFEEFVAEASKKAANVLVEVIEKIKEHS